MQHKVYLGSSNCISCGRKITKIVEIDRKHFGTECAKDILGKDYSAPIWLYQVADEYIQSKKEIENYEGDFISNFFNESYGHSFDCFDKYGNSKVWQKAIKIDGKSVKIDWQLEIADYLRIKHGELL